MKKTLQPSRTTECNLNSKFQKLLVENLWAPTQRWKTEIILENLKSKHPRFPPLFQDTVEFVCCKANENVNVTATALQKRNGIFLVVEDRRTKR